MIEVRWAATTHVGGVRAVNQDSILTGPTVFAIADGMGGHAAGEVASAIAIATLASLEDPLNESAIVAAIRAANDRVLAQASPGSGREGMGTTLVGLAVLGDPDDRVVVFNVGDSRAYRFRDHVLHQVSEDHSLVAELVRSGLLPPDRAHDHPHRNVITRVVGALPEPTADTWSFAVRPRDRFLLCSDGLSNEVTDTTIGDVLRQEADPQVAVDRLLNAALGAGARDNVSIVLVDVTHVVEHRDSLSDDTNPRVTTMATGGLAGEGVSATAALPLITHVPSPTDVSGLVSGCRAGAFGEE